VCTIPLTGTGVGVDFVQNFYTIAGTVEDGAYVGGTTITGEVRLVQTAVTDQTVDLTPSSSPLVRYPAQVVVPAGSDEVTFPITISPLSTTWASIFAISDVTRIPATSSRSPSKSGPDLSVDTNGWKDCSTAPGMTNRQGGWLAVRASQPPVCRKRQIPAAKRPAVTSTCRLAPGHGRLDFQSIG
jgi:hypothetical protein